MIPRRYICQSLKFVQGLRFYSTKNNKFLNIDKNEKTGITTITMNRPPVNALNLDFATELSETFNELEQEKTAGILLTSFSDKVFSTGLDFKEIVNPDYGRLKHFWTRIQDVMLSIYRSSHSTVAVINGHAPAGGCLLALCCDSRIMVDGYKIGLNETRVGIPVPPWLILLMQNTIGRRPAEVALTTACIFDTTEALKIGLVDAIATTKADALDKAMVVFKKYERISPIAIASTKKMLRMADVEFINDTREKDVENFASFILKSVSQRNIKDYINTLQTKNK